MNQDKVEASAHEAAEARRKRGGQGDFQGGRGPQKGKGRRWLVLLVDILLLAAIVAAVIFIVSLLTPFSVFDTEKNEERDITYRIEMAGVEIEYFNLKIGDAVIDSVTGAEIGKVVAFEGRDYEAYTDTAGDKNEEYGSHMVDKILYPGDEYQTITVTVAVTADYQSGVGYSAGDCRIAVGRNYQVRFPNYEDNAVCVSIYSSNG